MIGLTIKKSTEQNMAGSFWIVDKENNTARCVIQQPGSLLPKEVVPLSSLIYDEAIEHPLVISG